VSRRAVAALLLMLLLLGLGLAGALSLPERTAGVIPDTTATERIVFLAGGLSHDELVAFTSAVAASAHAGVVLLDSPEQSMYVKSFLATYRPGRIIPVGSFPQGLDDLERRLTIKTAPALKWRRGPPGELWKALFPEVRRVVVCPTEPRGTLLQAACLAGVMKAPLLVVRGDSPEETAELRGWLKEWRPREVVAVGSAVSRCREASEVRPVALADSEEVFAAYLREQMNSGPIQTLVLANPTDTRMGMYGMSSLAPWLALQRRAALVLTDETGANANTVIQAALKHPILYRAEFLLLAADLKAIPPEQRPNPLAGKDAAIEMEPMTPTDSAPFSFATGRLFHQDPAVVPLMLARRKLLATAPGPRKALVVSNPGGGLPLLETFSRNTVQEFRNTGYETAAFFGDQADKDEMRRRLPEQDIFLWEGHHKTLVEDFGLPNWTEPMGPTLVFLQSCLALNEEETRSLLSRGAIGIVGSSTRTYSASGGAISLAFFDALLYERQTLGGALRQAKNFLLTYRLLKEKRLGEGAKLSGANLRSSWAFTLWGDPTVQLAHPAPPHEARAAIHHELQAKTVVITVPEEKYPRVSTGKFSAQMPPNARLAGLLTPDAEEEARRMVPFVFVEVPLPYGPREQTPRLRSRIPERNWVFCWDGRRRCGYLLVLPRSRDANELRFRIEWEPEQGSEVRGQGSGSGP
jgi:hypothetical protein